MIAVNFQVINHRSKTVILAKNLPVGTTVNEVRELFSKHGILGRTLLPPHGITGNYHLWGNYFMYQNDIYFLKLYFKCLNSYCGVRRTIRS